MALKDIIGQDKAINILLRTLSRERMPSSYLFAGESGIGKKITAINLAKLLNCQKVEHISPTPPSPSRGEGKGGGENPGTGFSALGASIDACDQCPSCKKIDAQTHPDFLMIMPEKGEIRVDEIRAIEETLSFAPYEGKMKVVIVDDADTMNASAANAFLKTLEEPPSQSMIILISSSPDRLPETIRSRCSRVNFSPLSPEKCEEVIRKTTAPGAQRSALSLTARLSMGRPGLAIANDLLEERDWFIKLFREMISGGNKEAWTDKEEIEKWFNFAFTLLRDIAVLKITGKEDLLINMDIKEKIINLSKTLELKDIIERYLKISLLKGYLGFNLNKAITWNYVSTIVRELWVRY